MRARWAAAVEVAITAKLFGRIEEQLAILGPQLQGGIQDGEPFGQLPQLAVSPEEGARRPAGQFAEALEAAPQQQQGGLGLLEVAGSDEEVARVLLVLVFQAGGETVQLQGLLEAALVPEDVGQGMEVARVGGPAADRLAEQADGLLVLARVGTQLIGVLLPEDRVGIRAFAQLAQQSQPLVPSSQL